MRLLSVALLSCLLFFSAVAQNNEKVKMQLEVLNDSSQEINGALVSLLKAIDSSIIKIEISDNKGIAQFNVVRNIKFMIQVKAIGYRQYYSSPFFVGNDNNSLVVPAIHLIPENRQLKEVNITDKKPVIEKQLGKVVFNVANSPTAAGSSLFEVLQRSPGVTVDQNENIRLEGKAGTVIMIDDKSVQLSGDDLANMLKAITSSSVDKIEIITSPGSKYDAAGNAGIINIKLKKSEVMGFNGSITSSAGEGRYPKASIGTNLNYRRGKINLFGNYSYSYRKHFANPILNRSFLNDDTITSGYKQNILLVIPFNTQLARVGLDYKASKATTIGIEANGLQNKFNPYGNDFSYVLDDKGSEVSTFTTVNHSKDAWYNYALNGNLRTQFDTTGKALSIDIDYARYWNKTFQTFINNYYDLNGMKIQPTYILYGELPGTLNIKSFKADYSMPFKKDYQFEAGIKTSFVNTDNDIRFFDKSNSMPVYDSGKSNHFIYKENINAAYISFSGKYKKLAYQSGLRIEQTNTKGNQLVTSQLSDTSYLQLFPSLVLDYTLSAHHEFSINLNKRIDRPTYKQLNPFKFYIDPTTYVSGNPYLRPQETFNAEADYVFNKTLTIKLAYSQTHDNITEVLYPSESSSLITVQTDKNLKSVKYFSADISYAAEITKWWNTTSEFILYRGIYEGDVANTVLHNGNLTYNINSNNTYSFAKRYNAELDFEYRAGEVYGYYYIKPIWQLTAGLQTNVLKKKGTLKLNYSDIFSTYVVRGTTSFRDYYESFHTRKELSVCTLSFTYRFGKSSVPAANKRSSGAEDEKNRANTGNQ